METKSILRFTATKIVVSGEVIEDKVLFSALLKDAAEDGKELEIVPVRHCSQQLNSEVDQLIWRMGTPSRGVNSSSPPETVLFVARCLSPKSTREAILGDLHEDYAKVVAEQGIRRADIWCWSEIIRTAAFGLLNWSKLSLVMEAVRRLGS